MSTTTSFELIEARALGARLWIAVTPRGVRAVGYPNERREEFLERARRSASLQEQIPGCSGDLARRAASALIERVERDVWATRVPLDLAGSEFARAVWASVAAVPRGSRITYGALAAAAGNALARRAAGAVNRRNPAPPFVPHHRVVNGAGDLVAPPSDPWTPWRRRLFERERTAVSKPTKKRQ